MVWRGRERRVLAFRGNQIDPRLSLADKPWCSAHRRLLVDGGDGDEGIVQDFSSLATRAFAVSRKHVMPLYLLFHHSPSYMVAELV